MVTQLVTVRMVPGEGRGGGAKDGKYKLEAASE